MLAWDSDYVYSTVASIIHVVVLVDTKYRLLISIISCSCSIRLLRNRYINISHLKLSHRSLSVITNEQGMIIFVIVVISK